MNHQALRYWILVVALLVVLAGLVGCWCPAEPAPNLDILDEDSVAWAPINNTFDLPSGGPDHSPDLWQRHVTFH